MNEQSLQQRLKILIEGVRENWTYAIFWKSSVDTNDSSTFLGWGDGYFKEDDKSKRNTTTTTSTAAATAAEQEHRKKVFRELNSIICELPASATNDVDLVDEVTDPEWFFLVSMTQSFINGCGLPGRAFYSSLPIWIAGNERLLCSSCDRVKQGQMLGLQTMVCIPVANGVVELGSTELILSSESWKTYMVNNLRVLFNFNSHRDLEIRSSSSSMQEPTDQEGENDLYSSPPEEVSKIKDYNVVINSSSENSSATTPIAKKPNGDGSGDGAVDSNQSLHEASVRPRLRVDLKTVQPKKSPKKNN